MSLCSRCGAPFSCALVDGADPVSAPPCWCTLLPAVVPVPGAPGSACWCAACLRQHIAEQEAQRAAAWPVCGAIANLINIACWRARRGTHESP